MAAGLVLLAVMAPAFAVDHTVGDSSGWASGVDYTTWASDKTFKVGDTLVFQYGASHNVAEVGSADYSACSASNSIQSFSDQDTKITLTKPGTRYFICGVTGHCAGGMKLAVKVSPAATATTPAPAATPAAPSDTPSTTTPATTTPATTTPAATTPATATSTKSADSVGGASGVDARFAMGPLVGAVGLMGLALMG